MKKNSRFRKIIFKKINLNSLTRVVKIFFILHLIITILAIIYSSGFPLYWVIVGDPRTYANYGIPTISGLGALIRAFGLVGCLILYLFGTKKQKTLAMYIAIYYFLVLSF